MKKLSVLILMAGLFQLPVSSAAPSAPANIGVISFAEKPVQLIRGISLFTATQGTRLQAGDFIQSGPSVVQIEGLTSVTLALGPNTRIYMNRTGASTDVSLLSGWLKFQPATGAAHGKLSVHTSSLAFDVTNSASVIHANADKIEMFVEDGTQAVSELDDHRHFGRTLTVANEDYAVRTGYEPLQQIGRPQSAFVDSMPRAFLDPLVPIAKKTAAAPLPKKERDVDYEDISPWLLGSVNLNQKKLSTRFAPRLTDSVFRKKITSGLGGSYEWELELYRFESKKRLP